MNLTFQIKTTQKNSTWTPHHCPPSQNTLSHYRLSQGSWLALMPQYRQREAKEKQPSSQGLALQVLIGHSWEARKDIAPSCGIRKHKSVLSSLELWRGFPVCGTQVSSAELLLASHEHPKHLCRQVPPMQPGAPTLHQLSTAQTNRNKS